MTIFTHKNLYNAKITVTKTKVIKVEQKLFFRQRLGYSTSGNTQLINACSTCGHETVMRFRKYDGWMDGKAQYRFFFCACHKLQYLGK